MKKLIQDSRLGELLKQRNAYMVFAAGLLVLSVLLTFLVFYLTGRERIILVPPTMERSFWISSSEVSSEYISEMSIFFCFLRLNVTPDSVESQQNMLLKYIDPKGYGALKDDLLAERDHINIQHLSTAFYPINVVVDTKALTAKVTGDLIASSGTTQIPPQRVIYQISYRYDAGRLLVANFSEVKEVKANG